ncbi:MAG: hypothetical protein J6V15_04595 [Clostridia bacterium]|nr:hypothetical protein [Clostridia bacterium]
MANTLTPRDVYALMNEIVSQATGQKSSAVVDTSSFTTVGETLLRTAPENTLNAISTVLADTIFSVRPYRRKLESLRVSQRRWGAQVRKLVPLYSEAEESQDWNHLLNGSVISPLTDGQSVDMYKIKKPKMLQLNFYGTEVLQKHITRFRDQLSLAFSSETEFMRFMDAVMVEFSNEIELLNENKARLTLINFMLGIHDMGLTEVDLVAGYNTEHGTSYTRAQLLSTYVEDFMKYVAATIKTYSSFLTEMSAKNHANITGMAPILRHTPKERQKMIMYDPIFIKAESEVYSGLFNPQYLDIGDFEGVNFWQSQDKPTEIYGTPNILDVSDGTSKNGTSGIKLDYVLGLLFDEEALGVMPQFDYASTSPFNSSGGYWNLFHHWRFSSYCDYTENSILFVLGAGGA